MTRQESQMMKGVAILQTAFERLLADDYASMGLLWEV